MLAVTGRRWQLTLQLINPSSKGKSIMYVLTIDHPLTGRESIPCQLYRTALQLASVVKSSSNLARATIVYHPLAKHSRN
jgi:hypothetical protein